MYSTFQGQNIKKFKKLYVHKKLVCMCVCACVGCVCTRVNAYIFTVLYREALKLAFKTLQKNNVRSSSTANLYSVHTHEQCIHVVLHIGHTQYIILCVLYVWCTTCVVYCFYYVFTISTMCLLFLLRVLYCVFFMHTYLPYSIGRFSVYSTCYCVTGLALC